MSLLDVFATAFAAGSGIAAVLICLVFLSGIGKKK